MANVTIDLYRDAKRGYYNSNGENVNYIYKIQEDEYGAIGDHFGSFIIGSGFYADYESGISDSDTEAFSYLLGFLNGNSNDPTGNTYVAGSIQDLPKDLIDGLDTKVDKNPAAHIEDADTDAVTNLATNYNLATGLLGLADALNTSNSAQNDLASKYNDLATKVNTLFSHLESQELQEAS